MQASRAGADFELLTYLVTQLLSATEVQGQYKCPHFDALSSLFLGGVLRWVIYAGSAKKSTKNAFYIHTLHILHTHVNSLVFYQLDTKCVCKTCFFKTNSVYIVHVSVQFYIHTHLPTHQPNALHATPSADVASRPGGLA